ncbi:MAG TPA: hypothetical protein VHJ20_00985 [Polyangia bacterium]|nr:hypothetical protein [Polyangia bacterium]
MSRPAFRPIDGSFRTWSDGQRVHALVRFTGGNLGPNPVTMHATTELVPARALVRQRLMSGESVLAGDPVAVETLASRVGAFSALRRIGRAAKGAVLLSTAPVRALGGAGVSVLKATGNVAKGVESAAMLTEFATRPLAWRPHKKRGGSAPAAAPAAAPSDDSAPSSDASTSAPDQEEPMNDDTSGSPRPQLRHVMGAAALLRRAKNNPKAAKHVQTIAKAAAQGHPGAMLAQAAISEARKQPHAVPPRPPALPAHMRSAAFPAWARGAA